MSSALFDRLGIQSWCFRGLDGIPAIIEAMKELGVSRIELCGKHIDPFHKKSRDKTLEDLAGAGISVSAFGVHGFDADESKARPVFELAREAGFPTISADLRNKAAVPMLDKLCNEYGVKLAIHNHGRRHRWGPVWALEELFSGSSENFGLCLDAAWMLDSGSDPLQIAEKFRDRLYGLHVKDFVFDKAGKPEDVVVGTGNLDLPGMVNFLVSTGFDGYFTLEYEGDVDNPLPALKKCVAEIKKACEAAG